MSRGHKRGFTLVEVLVATAIFVIVAVSIYQAFALLLQYSNSSRAQVAANDLATEQFEIVRNMPYAQVGVVSSIPVGTIPYSQTIVRDGFTFQVISTIRNINDPFDSNIADADYKSVQFDITCTSCANFAPLSYTGQVSPASLNTSPSNGSLFVQVLNANGNPVPQASVEVVNNAIAPTIDIHDVTDNTGIYHLIDIPSSPTSYHIIVTKPGYSTAQTYPPGGPSNPNPTQPDLTVAAQQLTQTTLAIDQLSTINVSTVLPSCAVVPKVGYNIAGAKTIGTDTVGNPIYKYSATASTDNSGQSVLSNMEWDSYNINLADLNYDLAGSISQLPINLAPNSTQAVTLVVAPKNPKSVLFTIKDSATGLPLTTASIELQGTSGYDNTLVTSRGYLTQTDWSDGSGQANFASDTAAFFSSDGNIEYGATPGQVSLKKFFGSYAPSGSLISSTFDTGSGSNFYQLLWDPSSQPVAVGTPNVRFQIASNNDDATWNFTGPDGTASTYYDTTDQTIGPQDAGHRYLRYEMFLNTASTTYTPVVSDVSLTYTSSCVPPGQVIFTGLTNDTYTYTITKSGYQTTTGTIIINGSSAPWQNQNILLQSS